MDQLIFWFVIQLICHYIMAGEAAQNPWYGAETSCECRSSSLNGRVWKLEDQNSNQKEEISFLTTTVNQLIGRVSTLEASKTSDGSHDMIIDRVKRPFRLLPYHYSRSKDQNGAINYEEEHEFEGPPTSCKTLSKLGYTLNGFYLIKGKEKQSQSDITNKIQVAYCQFKQNKFLEGKEQHSSLMETLIGHVEIKSMSVHFYVQRNTSQTSAGVVPFEFSRLNVGMAMNVSTGIFTVPVHGIYHFEFSGSWVPIDQMAIYLQLNGARVASSYTYTKSASGDSYLSVGFTSSFRLKRGDRVSIFKDKGMLMDNQFFYTHFTGWLVEEDSILP